MKLLRLKISDIMALVVIAALDFAAMRALEVAQSETTHGCYTMGMLIEGGLPMANLLAIGLPVRYRRRGGHPFLLGFEAAGVVALATYTVLLIYFPDDTIGAYLDLFFGPPGKVTEWDSVSLAGEERADHIIP
jgi:hypothetical protein